MNGFSTLKRLMINDEGFAFDPVSGYTYTLNTTATPLIQLLKSDAEYDAILDHITETFDVTRQTADRDLESFIEQLKRLRLCENEEVQA